LKLLLLWLLKPLHQLLTLLASNQFFKLTTKKPPSGGFFHVRLVLNHYPVGSQERVCDINL
jgi:hypothetical protein